MVIGLISLSLVCDVSGRLLHEKIFLRFGEDVQPTTNYSNQHCDKVKTDSAEKKIISVASNTENLPHCDTLVSENK